MNPFTSEELKNISVLIQRSNITGAEAMAVAQLQVKISNMLTKETPVEEPKSETPTSE